MTTTDNPGDVTGPRWVGGVSDPALEALGESRARYGDLEARLVEAEAVIQKVREEAKKLIGWNVAAGGNFEAIVGSYRPVVLADHDKAVRQVTLREAAQSVHDWASVMAGPEGAYFARIFESRLRALAEGDTNA